MINKVYDETKDFINDLYDSDLKDDYTIVSKYFHCEKILKEIISSGNVSLKYIDLSDSYIDGYADEYAIHVYDDELYCERLKVKDRYLAIGGELLLVIDDVSKEYIDSIDHSIPVIFVSINGEKDNSKDLQNKSKSSSLYLSKDDDGNTVGFTKFWSDTYNNISSSYSFSFYSDDIKRVDEVLNMFEKEA